MLEGVTLGPFPSPASPHFQVIYGDTDSVMIHTGTDDVREARDLGARIKREVREGGAGDVRGANMVWVRGGAPLFHPNNLATPPRVTHTPHPSRRLPHLPTLR